MNGKAILIKITIKDLTSLKAAVKNQNKRKYNLKNKNNKIFIDLLV